MSHIHELVTQLTNYLTSDIRVYAGKSTVTRADYWIDVKDLYESASLTPTGITCSVLDEDLSAATGQAIIASPENLTITQVFAKVGTVATGSTIIIDINVNGTSILSTKITIDASEKTSLTAAIPPVLSSTSLVQGDEITIDIDQAGATIAGKDLTVYILGTKL